MIWTVFRQVEGVGEEGAVLDNTHVVGSECSGCSDLLVNTISLAKFLKN